MFDGLKSYGSNELLKKLTGKNPFFICTIATTSTAIIPNITGAGATPELMEYTPAGDVELIVHSELRCCDIPPQTIIDGASAPTPAMLTKAALELTDVPYLIVDAGSKIKPDVPYITVAEEGEYGHDIRTGHAVVNPRKIFENSKIIGHQLSKYNDYLVIGESIPAGTTTALGTLTALGYDADFKVSGSMPENPHNLKKDVVMEGLANGGILDGMGNIGKIDPFIAVSVVGDPMIPAVAGLVLGSNVPVILAGGTQMASVCGFIKAIDPDFDFARICLGTTSFVADDNTSDLFNITAQIGDINIHAVNPQFGKSKNMGLKNYLNGFVKEGVGAGGAMLMALLLGYSIDDIRQKVEEVCE
ncbi:TIGR00303 family protein [Methanobrevibacter sp. TMH8]|uniref:nicotinate mononucleotide-dependent phosphoribosyltransferase CobT n=1 Tax=Methanobrevibacter sp. TMH8 TaxID=2848611 RepID=UPI001CC9EEB3|nr:TIGR00303 family protein [Methanobrevibacter sp. TMH8]MBZ9571135.1 TIGR00303 family protein [Methanobrevibacter sp. TMH8]